FTDRNFNEFQAADDDASKEKEITISVIPFIEGSCRDGRCRNGGIPFRNLDPLTNGTIVPGNPDRYYGARPELLKVEVREELNHLIVPTSEDHLPLCPNFFLAAKGPNGTSAVAQLQVAYDGALGARAIHSLQRYQRAPSVSDFDYKASTITSSYHDGQLKMYAVCRAEPVDSHDRAEYHVHQLNTWGMTGNIETFRQGATAYRNARDWAEKVRDEAIACANAQVLEKDVVADSVVRASVEHEIGQSYMVGESPSPESARYTTPPTEQTTGTSLVAESPVSRHDTNKRDRKQIQGSSPMQQTKRHRFHDQDGSPPLKSSTMSESISTNISFQFAEYDLERRDRT
ncbi:hypothetical protein LTR51_008858, partial [Lithohypha guttulata]